MKTRQYDRVPYSLRVQFRKASSLLVAYSVNLSRGGVFLDTAELLPVGTSVTLELAVPDAGPVTVSGRVTWVREQDGELGPRGIGIEFEDVVDGLGALIDRLAGEFAGIHILHLCADADDRKSLSRVLTSILSTADVASAGDQRVAEALLDDVDVAILDFDDDAAAAEAVLAAARARSPRVPALALASTAELAQRAKDAGADAVLGNPPAFGELRSALLSALAEPAQVSVGG